MKYFIVGLHSNGKHNVLDYLEKLGVRCGHLFSDLTSPSSKIYNSYNYELYTAQEVNEIFENNAYIFLHTRNVDNKQFYEGLSKYEFDNNDVFVLSPDQVLDISFNSIKEPICFIWLDGTREHRYNTYRDEHREYNFKEREDLESRDSSTFISTLYDGSHKLLYFKEEVPERVGAIIYTLIHYPELLDLYTLTFN